MMGTNNDQLRALLVFLITYGVQASIRPIDLPDSLFKCFQTFSKKHFFMNGTAEQLSQTCLQRYMWSDVGIVCNNMTKPELDYIDSLLAKFLRNREKRQAQRRLRREYRSLTLQERNAYHQAVRALKNRPAPRNYDTIARYHQANVGRSAHGGPAFLPWHRIYLLIYEEALIEASNGQIQALPYLDFRLDSRLSNPTSSVLWTPDFLGTGNGRVDNGPFANWVVDGSTLVRNLGDRSLLMTDAETRRLFRRGISVRNFGQECEFLHNGAHVFVGGMMSELQRASFDPTFFMYHCFIDYLWWRYQCPTSNNCISSRFVYPGRSSDGLHAPNRFMDNLSLNGRVRNREGYEQRWLNIFTYASSPAECTNACTSLSRAGALDCTTTSCRSASTGGNTGGNGGGGNGSGGNGGGGNGGTDYYDYYYDSQPITGRKKRSTDQNQQPSSSTMPSTVNKNYFLAYPVQNLYRINCVSDTSKWAFIPIKVINVRANSDVYNSYPVKNGKVVVSTSNDIYDQLPEIQKIDRLTRPGNQTHYNPCKTDDSGAFRISVTSYGLNYYGTHMDYVIMDNRAPLYSAMTYIAVRRPTRNKSSKVYLTSFDNCGRTCTVECLVPGSKPPRYVTCSGAIEIDRKGPKGYGATYDDAVLMYYNFKEPGGCPVSNEESVPVVFYCRKANNWIYSPNAYKH